MYSALGGNAKQKLKSLVVNAKSVTKTLDYLILGTYVTDSWAHESFGRKIEKAVKYRESGTSIVIMSEEQWLEASGL